MSDDDNTNSRKRRLLDEDNDEDNENEHNSSNKHNSSADDLVLLPPPHKKQRCENETDIAPPPIGDDNNGSDDTKYDEPIRLNVGGIEYYTTMQTLTGYKSMLKARFSSKYSVKPSKDGTYFIDRDGTLFAYVLDYLRNGELILPSKWTKNDLWRFYNEIKYFGIDSLFDTVLLKLFNSNIIQNPTIKLKLIEKLMSVSDVHSKKMQMESLREWKLIFEYDYKNVKFSVKIDSENQNRYLFNSDQECLNIGSSLMLAQANNSIYGMYVQTKKGYYIFSKSFAFNAGDGSYHIIRNIDPNKVKFKYFNLRKPNENELKNAGIDEKVYTTFFNELYPFLLTRTISGYILHGSFWITDVSGDEPSLKKSVSKLEVWSIPNDFC